MRNTETSQGTVETFLPSGNRVKMPKINREELSGILVIFPNKSEQKAIVHFIENTFLVIDKLIAEIDQEISLITEYRTSLISDVVTGKVDVRGIEVPELIEDPTEIEIEDESDEEIFTDSDESEE